MKIAQKQKNENIKENKSAFEFENILTSLLQLKIDVKTKLQYFAGHKTGTIIYFNYN